MKKVILSYIEKVPALSPTIAKIVQLTSSDTSSAVDLVQAIKLDPALTVKVLNLINSSYFGMPQEVTSINRAIILLGMNTIKNLALSAEVLSSFNPSKGALFNVDKFWQHSLACAISSKLIAQRIIKDPVKREEFFIAGLIHDIGKIFFIKHFPRDYLSMVKKVGSSDSLNHKERLLFTMDHAEVGGLIAEKWALPPDLVASIRLHHERTVKGETSFLPASVYISNLYCKTNGYGDDIGAMVAKETDDQDWGRLNLHKVDEAEILSCLPEKVEEAKVFLQVRSK
ncbi:HDOD domain-containing protein [Candidatus Magnetominusculus dajiuhuensis]|uniref:HDOD domain-containing protein n=1 Tax=Candidatus Magnetominusculus dajiuhuensis TaxID=3137712 RepID=UPI003B42D7F4